MPKMACHDFTYPWGICNGKVLAEGRKWAHLPWRTGLGQIRLGQDLWTVDGGAVQFVYDMDRFVPERFEVMQSIAVHLLRSSDHLSFLIHHDLEKYDLFTGTLLNSGEP